MIAITTIFGPAGSGKTIEARNRSDRYKTVDHFLSAPAQLFETLRKVRKLTAECIIIEDCEKCCGRFFIDHVHGETHIIPATVKEIIICIQTK